MSKMTGSDSPLIKGLREEREDPKYTDVVVAVDDKEFPCHRVILAATSEFFKGLFNSAMKETLEGKVHIGEISAETFETILRWMYFQDDILSEDNMYDVVMAANQIQIDVLLEEGKQFIKDKLSPKNCVYSYLFSKNLQWKPLEEAAWKCLLHKFDSVDTADLNSLPVGDIKLLVSSPDLVAYSEDSVVDRVLQWIDIDGSSESEQRVKKRAKHLGQVLKSCRYLLVSSHFVWETLDKNSHVQADERCRELVREILTYKTQSDLHQWWCPPAAILRNSCKQMNVLLLADVGEPSFKYISFTSDTCSFTTYPFRFPRIHRAISGAALYNGALYIEACTDEISGRSSCVHNYLYVCDSDSQTVTQCNLIVKEPGSKTVAFLPIGHSLVALRASANNQHSIESINLECAVSSEWRHLGRPVTQGLELAFATSIGSKLFMLWKETDAISMEWFDLEQHTSCKAPGRLKGVSSVVTFRSESQVFVLQDDGILWRLCDLSKAPYVDLVQEKQLWTGKYVLYGAIVANHTLHVAKQDDGVFITWCEQKSIAGVFTNAVTVNIYGPPCSFIQAPLFREYEEKNKKGIETKPQFVRPYLIGGQNSIMVSIPAN